MSARLTKQEKAAIADLEALGRRWPQTLTLFSWSGSLQVWKPAPGLTIAEAKVTDVPGIPNDGGDPSGHDRLWGAPGQTKGPR